MVSITMTTTNHPTVDAEPDDDLVVNKLLNELIMDDRWNLTDLGRTHLREARTRDSEIMERLQDRDKHSVNHILNDR